MKFLVLININWVFMQEDQQILDQEIKKMIIQYIHQRL